MFVRVNSGGIKLSYSDLLFSKLKIPWQGVKNEFKALLDSINSSDFDFDVDFIIKTCLFLFAEKSQEIKYKVENFNDDKINSIKTNWPDIQKAIRLTVDLIEYFGITSKKVLTSNNAIIPIIYWIYTKKYKSIGEDPGTIVGAERERIRLWLIKVLIKTLFGGQSDSILHKVKTIIDISIDEPLFPAQEIENDLSSDLVKNLQINVEEFLDSVCYRDKNSYFALNIIYKGSVNFSPSLRGNLPEQDHIFSKDELAKHGYTPDRINSIYNIRLIEKSSNIIKSNKPMEKWAGSKVEAELKEIYKKHCIPASGDHVWNIKQFDDFIAKRKEAIIKLFDY